MRILFVDNHPEFTAIVTGAFLSAHEVVIVPTVAAARAVDGDFDVALVDHDLDDGTGVEFVRWARIAKPSLPMIAVSARAEGNEALVGAGAQHVCAKIDFARIGAVLATLSGRAT